MKKLDYKSLYSLVSRLDVIKQSFNDIDHMLTITLSGGYIIRIDRASNIVLSRGIVDDVVEVTVDQSKSFCQLLEANSLRYEYAKYALNVMKEAETLGLSSTDDRAWFRHEDSYVEVGKKETKLFVEGVCCFVEPTRTSVSLSIEYMRQNVINE